MANIKISQLPAASVVTAGSDVLPMVHAGVTQKVTPDLLVQTVLSAPGPIGDDVAGSAAFTTLTASGEVTLNPADANVALSPTGSGAVNIQPNGGLLINPASVGSLNNVAIGGATPQPGTFTALTSTGATTLNGTTIPDSVTLVDTDSAQTLAQKTLAYPRIWDPDRSNYYRITPVGNLALDVYTFLPVLTGNDYFSFRNFAETLTNKTISGASNTLTNIGNPALTNSSITIGSSPVSLGGTLSSVSGLSIDSSAIGASAASTGAFTTLSASSTVSGTGFSTYLASPPAIGGTTPAAGNFTTLGATGNVTLGDAAVDTLTINAGTTNFAGTGQRITGDFSNATAANRLLFQTSTVDGGTSVGLIPNGTSPSTELRLFSSSNTSNNSTMVLANNGAEVTLRSGISGTGTYLPMTFYTGGTERLRIDSSGNLLVGDTSNTSPPNRVVICSNNFNLALTTPASGQVSALAFCDRLTSKTYVYYTPANTSFYIVNNTQGVVLTANATSWASASDERIKTNLQPIGNAAQKVSTLRAVTGRFKTDEESISRAFLIAQDVQAVLPEAVDDSDPEKLSLRYTETIPLLVAAIKELHQEIETLKQRIA